MTHEENYLTPNCGSPFLVLWKELQYLTFPHLISRIWSHLYHETERIRNLTPKCECIIVKSPQAHDHKIQYFLISKCYKGNEGWTSEAGKSDVLAADENRHQLASIPQREEWCCLCNLQIQELLMLFWFEQPLHKSCYCALKGVWEFRDWQTGRQTVRVGENQGGAGHVTAVVQ